MHNQIASFRARRSTRAPCPATSGCCCCSSPLLLVTDGYDAQVLGYVVPTLAQEWGLEAAFGGVQRQPVRPDRRFACW
ncbi:hypothetical protein BANRA_00003 [Pseudomonas aeruginosa]|nr:hypothetical protein BANRA_00003 [Pseudomonas aeruginosa]